MSSIVTYVLMSRCKENCELVD